MNRLTFSVLLLLTPLRLFAADTKFYCQPTAMDGNLNAGSTTNDAAHFQVDAATWTSATRVLAVGAVDMSSVAVGDFMSVYTNGAPRTHYVALVIATNETLNTITLSATADSGTPPADGTVNARGGGAWKGPDTDHAMFPWGFVENTLTNASGDPIKVYYKFATNMVIAGVTHSFAGPVTWEGYSETPGDGGMSIIDGSLVVDGTPFVMLTMEGGGHTFKNLWFRNNYAAPQAGAQSTGNHIVRLDSHQNYFFNCKISGAYRGCIYLSGSGGSGGNFVVKSLIFDGQYDDANNFALVDGDEEGTLLRCVISGSGRILRAGASGTQSAGIDLGNASGEPINIIECIIADTMGDGIFASASSANANILNCNFVRTGLSGTGDGVDLQTVSQTSINLWVIENSIFEHAAGYGIRNDAQAPGYPFVVNCGFFGNTNGTTLNVNASFITNSITFTASPFVDSVNGDWRLNNTAGAGADARGAAANGFLIDTTEYSSGASTVGHRDMGAVQHEDEGGGGVAIPAYSFPSSQ